MTIFLQINVNRKIKEDKRKLEEELVSKELLSEKDSIILDLSFRIEFLLIEIDSIRKQENIIIDRSINLEKDYEYYRDHRFDSLTSDQIDSIRDVILRTIPNYKDINNE